MGKQLQGRMGPLVKRTSEMDGREDSWGVLSQAGRALTFLSRILTKFINSSHEA